jgi:hypothetical protein
MAEIKSLHKSWSASYHSVRKILSSRLLSKYIKITFYENTVLLFVFCGCGTWSVILGEGYRERVFENWMLRKIVRPKWKEVTAKWRKFRKEGLHNLFSLSNSIWIIKSRMMR